VKYTDFLVFEKQNVEKAFTLLSNQLKFDYKNANLWHQIGELY